MSPTPAAVQEPPPVPMQLQVGAVSEAGTVSDTVAPVTGLGPALLATIVYVIACPGEAVDRPSVFVIERSAAGMIVSASVALLFPGFGSVIPLGVATVAVFDSVPEALISSVPVAVNVAVPPEKRLTVWLMFPEPLAAPQVDPAEAVHVQVIPMRTAGKVSVTAAPVTPSGPASPTMIVYVTGFPAPAVVWPSVLVTNRSAEELTLIFATK